MKILYTLIALLSATSAFAQLNGDGYYRVQSYYTQRYLYLMDNTGKVDATAATADVGAIVPYKSKDRMISDPATVLYIESISGGYKLHSQGVATTDIIDNLAIKIALAPTLAEAPGTYWCWATKAGSSLYLADTRTNRNSEEGIMETIGPERDNKGRELRRFYFRPITSTNDDNYFGVKPTFTCNGKHYASFYAAFPFSFASPGMKAYIVTKNTDEVAVLSEVTTGIIPAKTPVLIECLSENPSDNRLNIGGNASNVSGNILAGNFFCYDPDPENSGRKDDPHENLTPFTSKMRVFGVTSEGKLGLVTPTDKYISANTAYLNSSVAGLKPQLTLMTEQEYMDYTGIEGITMDDENKDGKTYTIGGAYVGDSAPKHGKGLYIRNGKKVLLNK